MTALAQDELPWYPEILRTLVRYNLIQVGDGGQAVSSYARLPTQLYWHREPCKPGTMCHLPDLNYLAGMRPLQRTEKQYPMPFAHFRRHE